MAERMSGITRHRDRKLQMQTFQCWTGAPLPTSHLLVYRVQWFSLHWIRCQPLSHNNSCPIATLQWKIKSRQELFESLPVSSQTSGCIKNCINAWRTSLLLETSLVSETTFRRPTRSREIRIVKRGYWELVIVLTIFPHKTTCQAQVNRKALLCELI